MTNAPIYTHAFWAKTFPYRQLGPERIHLLEHHLADVGACFEALLQQPTIRRRLARSGGLDDLDDAMASRLAVFAALHDIGKINIGFQAQVWRDADIPPGRRRPPRMGHTLDLTPILNGEDTETNWFFDALGWEDFLKWDDRYGETACALFAATLSHHGRPLQLEGARQRNPGAWRPFGSLNPSEYTARIGKLIRQWFPAAFATGAPPLPAAPAFQHHFLGLCNLADWIGSNEKWFEFVDTPHADYITVARNKAARAIDAVGLNLTGQRQRFTSVPDFGQLFDIPEPPRAIQRKAQNIPFGEQLVIMESETGSGKTEAALWRFARMYEANLVDGVYFALPTRAAAAQIHGRVQRFIANLFPAEVRPPVVLAVPGYEPDTDAEAAELADYNASWNGEHDNEKPWSTENPKRYLTAQIAVGTIDQALLGALQVKNAHMRMASLSRNLLVVDEVHASDVYMGGVLERLLAAHLGAGGYALLMSATLGSAARSRWLQANRRDIGSSPLSLPDAIATPYPAISIRGATGESVTDAGENGQEKTVSVIAVPEMPDFAAVAQRALSAARAGAKTLVIRNTVGNAIGTQRAIEELAGSDDKLLFALNGVQTLHHGRFAASDRRLLDQRVEELLGKDRQPGGCIVVGTQTLEQSLDIDADLLITDLCPVDVLLQRIGRLHRRRRDDRPVGYDRTVCIVLTPPDNDLTPLLDKGENANGLGPYGGVYPSLQILEATLRLIAQHPQWRIPEMNRELVERATHSDALEAITQEMGDRWREHAIDSAGGHIADAQTARSAVISFDKSFFGEDNRQVLFPDREESIRTRLGDDRVDISFDPPMASPFDDSPIDHLAMTTRWLSNEAVPKTPVEPTPTDGGFEFSIGNRRFRYDRLGLHRVQA